MEKNTRKEIDQFLECRTMAVAGVSRKEKSFSASAIKHLEALGYDILQVNPNFEEELNESTIDNVSVVFIFNTFITNL